MTYVIGQATAPTGATVALFTVPPGLCNVTFWNPSAVPVLMSTSKATASNGVVCHSIPTSFFTYVSNAGATVYGANTSGTAASVNYIIATDA